MASIQETLGRKIGPLPLGVWFIAVGGGLGLSYYMQAKAGDETVDEDLPEDDPYSYEPLPYAPPNFGGGVALPDYGTGVIEPVQTRPVTNDEWLMLGVEFLVSNGTNALMANNALAKYLEGKALNSQEQALVSRIIRAYGSPPEGAPTLEQPIPTPTDPPDTPTTAPRWHSTTPQNVASAYSAVSVAAVLTSLGVNWRTQGPLAVDKYDIAAGLKKLGWRNATDLSVTLRNVGRLMAKQRAPSQPTETPTWGSGIPLSVRRSKDARVQPIPVKSALLKVGLRPGNSISATDVKAGYKRVRMTATKITPELVAEFVRRARNM